MKHIPNDGRSYIPFPETKNQPFPGTSFIPQPGPNPVIGKCPKCGLELHRMMMYCCPNTLCPTGLGSLWF